MLNEDIEALGAVRLRDVDAAQAEIVSLIKQMALRGDIEIPGTGEVEEMIG